MGIEESPLTGGDEVRATTAQQRGPNHSHRAGLDDNE
jgi:hypothetical protein